MMADNDDTPRDVFDEVVEEVVGEFMARSAPLLRALLRQRFKVPAPMRRAALREAPGDRERADEVARARARKILEGCARRGRR